MDRLGKLLADGDGNAAARVSHAFKGSAGMLGLLTLADAAGSIERVLKAADAGHCDPRIRLLMDSIRSTMVVLESILP